MQVFILWLSKTKRVIYSRRFNPDEDISGQASPTNALEVSRFNPFCQELTHFVRHLPRLKIVQNFFSKLDFMG